MKLLPPAAKSIDRELRLATRLPIPPFPYAHEIHHVVWCFQTCHECRGDIAGYSGVIISTNGGRHAFFQGDCPAFNVACLFQRPERSRRRREEQRKRAEQENAAAKLAAMGRYVAELSAAQLEYLLQLVEQERGRRV